MDLYIRSQDRMALSKYDLLIAEETPTGEYMFIADHYKNMGTYKTKERTLEVLDEIHNILKPKGILKFNTLMHEKDLAKIKEKLNDEYLVFNQNVELIQQPTTYVYEMPEE